MLFGLAQSRCAILRYVKLTDEQVLSRVEEVCKKENVRAVQRAMTFMDNYSSLQSCAVQVPRTPDGLEAIVFTAEGDLRNALNNLQSTYAGFGVVTEANVYKVSGPWVGGVVTVV
jgi:replication factor C subunit 2/4